MPVLLPLPSDFGLPNPPIPNFFLRDMIPPVVLSLTERAALEPAAAIELRPFGRPGTDGAGEDMDDAPEEPAEGASEIPAPDERDSEDMMSFVTVAGFRGLPNLTAIVVQITDDGRGVQVLL